MTEGFVSWFRAVAPYIHAHRGKTLVIACPGEAFIEEAFVQLSYDLSLLASLGMKIVLVHGARPQIEAALKKRAIADHYHQGRRVTDENMLNAIKEVVGALRFDIEARLSIGLMGSPMQNAVLRVATGNYLLARPLGVVEGVDFQYTGTVRKVDVEAIQAALNHHQLVLVSPIGYSPSGEVFNLRYEEAAARVAMALKADKLIYLTAQVFQSAIPEIGEYTVKQVAAILEAEGWGAIDPIEARTLQYAMSACQGGVDRVHLIPLNMPGSLLRELFTHKGVGLMMTQDPAETIRKATLEDLAGILRIIEPMEQQGILIRRDRQQLEREIDRFMVIEHDHRILGCMALYPLEDHQAELACFAVDPDHRQEGYASRMLQFVRVLCREKGITKVYVLTTQTTHWFMEHGFRLTDIHSLPLSKQALYNWQRASKILELDV